jgi:hypothetical protein
MLKKTRECYLKMPLLEAGVLEVIGSRGESTWHDNGCPDPLADKLVSVANRQDIHRGLGGEVRSEIWWRSSARTSARDTENQSLSLRAKMRKRGAVYTLRAEHIGVI